MFIINLQHIFLRTPLTLFDNSYQSALRSIWILISIIHHMATAGYIYLFNVQGRPKTKTRCILVSALPRPCMTHVVAHIYSISRYVFICLRRFPPHRTDQKPIYKNASYIMVINLSRSIVLFGLIPCKMNAKRADMGWYGLFIRKRVRSTAKRWSAQRRRAFRHIKRQPVGTFLWSACRTG